MRKTIGFSTIELLIVLATIGVIAGIAIPSLLRSKEKQTSEKALLEKASSSKTDMIVWNRLSGPSHGDGWAATVYWVVNPTTQDTVYILPEHGIFVLPAKPFTAEAAK
jgi:type II secretory pathway pseudopilin PulG